MKTLCLIFLFIAGWMLFLNSCKTPRRVVAAKLVSESEFNDTNFKYTNSTLSMAGEFLGESTLVTETILRRRSNPAKTAISVQ